MPLSYQRSDRVATLVRNELGKIIIRELEFPGALVTIFSVEVTKKLDYAKVHVSVIPSGKADSAMRILKRERGRLQHLLLHKINIKPMPEISFILDRGLEKAAEIEKALLDAEQKNR